MTMTCLHFPDRYLIVIKAIIMTALMCFPMMVRADITGPYKHVMFLNPGHATETFWAQMIRAASTTADSLGITLEVVSAKRNTDEFIRLGTQAMMREIPPDLLITTNNHGLALPLLDLTDTTGVPIMVVLNSLSPEQTRTAGKPLGHHAYWLGSVSPDHRQGGHDTMQALIKRYGAMHDEAQGAAIALVGGQRDQATRLRLDGMHEAMRNAPYLILDRIFLANWSYDDAFTVVDRYLQRQQDGVPLRLIWAANDLMAIAAIDALKRNGQQPGKDVLVAGMGWTREGIDHLRSGEMEASAGGGALATAWSIALLAAVQEGVIPPERIGTRYYRMGLATSDDPDAYLDAIALQVLALKPMDHLVKKVASLPEDASPFLPVSPRLATAVDTETPDERITTTQGAPRHGR